VRQTAASRGFGVENRSRAECAYHAGDPDLAEVGVNPDLGELRAEGVHRELLGVVIFLGPIRGFYIGLPGSSEEILNPSSKRAMSVRSVARVRNS
jgi:hypothetical protein